MKNIIYRVVIKIGYNDSYFDFNNPESATLFADNAKVANTESGDGFADVSIRLMTSDEIEAERQHKADIKAKIDAMAKDGAD